MARRDLVSSLALGGRRLGAALDTHQECQERIPNTGKALQSIDPVIYSKTAPINKSINQEDEAECQANTLKPFKIRP